MAMRSRLVTTSLRLLPALSAAGPTIVNRAGVVNRLYSSYKLREANARKPPTRYHETLSQIGRSVPTRAASTSSDAALGRTALYDLHVKHGGTMVPFGGYEMPVQYSDLSIGESHKWTREKASIFDVGHM